MKKSPWKNSLKPKNVLEQKRKNCQKLLRKRQTFAITAPNFVVSRPIFKKNEPKFIEKLKLKISSIIDSVFQDLFNNTTFVSLRKDIQQNSLVEKVRLV